MKYIPGLDGVRALAVSLVILMHYSVFMCGWIGVQLFFVLSGFLITDILLAAKSDSSLSRYLKNFYIRRTLRIFPLYYMVLLVAALSWYAVGHPASIAQDWPWLLTYTYNIARLQPDVQATNSLTHFWSLSVEEQFYLVWPVIVFYSAPHHFRRFLVLLVIALPCLRLLCTIFAAQLGAHPGYLSVVIYNATFFQCDAFAWGALLAAFRREAFPDATRLCVYLFALFALLGLTNLALYHVRGLGIPFDSLGYPLPEIFHIHGQVGWGYTIINALSMALILAVLVGKAWTRIFSLRIPVAIGRVSYGMYIFHLPLLSLLTPLRPADHWGLASLGFFVAYFASVYLLARVSFEFFEAPFLRLKDRFTTAVKRPST